jgi:hypothetical protein
VHLYVTMLARLALSRHVCSGHVRNQVPDVSARDS